MTAVLGIVATAPLVLPLDVWRADDALQMQDAYKWIYQATQGGEHAAPSREDAARWLQNEWEALGPVVPGEPPLEPLGTSGIVRLNLRPYRAAGGTAAAVLDAFLRSAQTFKPDRVAFERTWTALGSRLRAGSIGRLTRAEWERLEAEMRPRGYPAAHHSDRFTEFRHPAYRVLTSAEAEGLLRR